MCIIMKLLKIILFMPAIIGTYIITVLYGPTIPISLIFTFVFLWIGSELLAFNKVIGSVIGIMSPVLLLIIMHGEYMHVDHIPYSILYIVFYIVCGFIIYRNNKKRTHGYKLHS